MVNMERLIKWFLLIPKYLAGKVRELQWEIMDSSDRSGWMYKNVEKN